MQIDIRPRRIATIFVLVALTFGAAHLATQYYAIRVAPRRITAERAMPSWPADAESAAKREEDIRNPRGIVNLFDLDREDNLPNTWSALQLFIAALVLDAIARHSRSRGDGNYRHWRVLSLVFVLLSLDEGASLHNQLHILSGNEHQRAARGFFYFSWVIPAGIATALYGLSNIKFLWRLPASTRWLMIFTGAAYVASAVGGEMIEGKWIATGHGKGRVFSMMTLAEETGEMLSIAVFIWTLLTYAATTRLIANVSVSDRSRA